MSEPTQDTATADHDVLTQMVGEIGEELRGLLAGYQQHAANPRTWPHLAAALQLASSKMAEAGERLAAELAAYAEEYPEIEVPADGPAVMLLPESEHREYWNLVGDLYDPTGYEATLQAYAEVLEGEHGRPELDVRAVALDESAVMVLQYLTEQGPDAVVQVYIGGWDYERHSERIAEALAEHGIDPGAPRFWPPLVPDNTVLAMGETDLYDPFGRRVNGSPQADAERAVRTVERIRDYLRQRELLLDDRKLSASGLADEITTILNGTDQPDPR